MDLTPYLPTGRHLTLTYAQSIDGLIAAAPHTRTRLSGSESKQMTHFLRSKHDAILVGVSTVLADNPRLNCRYEGSTHSPVPVVLDGNLRLPLKDWEKFTFLKNASLKITPGPVIIVNKSTEITKQSYDLVAEFNGTILSVNSTYDWQEITDELAKINLKSVMVEGGGKVIESVFEFKGIVKSVIVTLAPVYLGKEGVWARPKKAHGLKDPEWFVLGGDVVMAARGLVEY